MKLCQDCKHFTPDTNSWEDPKYQKRWATCGLTATVLPTLGRSCAHERGYGWIGARLLGVCGIEGRFFKPTHAGDAEPSGSKSDP